MAITVELEIKRNFDVDCPFERVFDVLADVPYSVSHFPKVERLVDLGDNTYRWEMEKIGVQKYYIQTIYACKYIANRKEGTIKWEPVEGEGNALVKGRWKLLGFNGDTNIDFYTHGKLTVPLPGFLKMVVRPVVTGEFNSLVDQYIENLKKTFAEKAKAE